MRNRLKRQLASFGADPARWQDRPAAEYAFDADPEMKALLLEAQALDRALDTFDVPEIPSHLATSAANEALLRARQPHKKSRRLFAWPQRQVMAGAGAAFAALVIVIALGYSPVAPRPDADQDVGRFLQDIDHISSAEQAQLHQADEVFGMLTPDQENRAGQSQ